MKQIILILLAVVFTLQLQAQRYAVIDTRYILNKLPEYEEAQKKLDAFSIQWQKEIDDKQMALDQLYRNFEAERVMLSEELLKKRKDLGLRATYLKEDKNLLSQSKTGCTMRCRKLQLPVSMT